MPTVQVRIQQGIHARYILVAVVPEFVWRERAQIPLLG
jgi:hypothetical protein